MMGVNNWQHWAAWFIMFFISTLIVISFMTILFCIEVHVSGPLGCAQPCRGVGGGAEIRHMVRAQLVMSTWKASGGCVVVLNELRGDQALDLHCPGEPCPPSIPRSARTGHGCGQFH